MKKEIDPARARWLKKRHKARLKQRRARPGDLLWFGDLPAPPKDSPARRFRPIRDALNRVVAARAELPRLPPDSLPLVFATTMIRYNLAEADACARREYTGEALARVLAIIDRYRQPV